MTSVTSYINCPWLRALLCSLGCGHVDFSASVLEKYISQLCRLLIRSMVTTFYIKQRIYCFLFCNSFITLCWTVTVCASASSSWTTEQGYLRVLVRNHSYDVQLYYTPPPPPSYILDNVHLFRFKSRMRY